MASEHGIGRPRHRHIPLDDAIAKRLVALLGPQTLELVVKVEHQGRPLEAARRPTGLGVEADKVTDNASFIDDLGADSLDTVELVMAFEEEFGCEIPDDAAEQIQTVGDAVKFLEQHASAAGTPPAS